MASSADRHNIWEIVVHAAYWKYIVRRRLLGEKKGSFPLKGSNWIKRPIVMRENAWREDIRLLDEMHHSMCEAIALLKPSISTKNLPAANSQMHPSFPELPATMFIIPDKSNCLND